MLEVTLFCILYQPLGLMLIEVHGWILQKYMPHNQALKKRKLALENFLHLLIVVDALIPILNPIGFILLIGVSIIILSVLMVRECLMFMSIHFFLGCIRIYLGFFFQIRALLQRRLFGASVVRIEFEKFPEYVEDHRNLKIIKHQLILGKNNVVHLILGQYGNLVILDFFLFVLGRGLVQFLEKLYQLVLHFCRFPDAGYVGGL